MFDPTSVTREGVAVSSFPICFPVPEIGFALICKKKTCQAKPTNMIVIYIYAALLKVHKNSCGDWDFLASFPLAITLNLLLRI
jgi:hypothetical protein